MVFPGVESFRKANEQQSSKIEIQKSLVMAQKTMF
jgi:hypothetical protein